MTLAHTNRSVEWFRYILMNALTYTLGLRTFMYRFAHEEQMMDWSMNLCALEKMRIHRNLRRKAQTKQHSNTYICARALTHAHITFPTRHRSTWTSRPDPAHQRHTEFQRVRAHQKLSEVPYHSPIWIATRSRSSAASDINENIVFSETLVEHRYRPRMPATNIHPPSPSKFTPFCWKGLVQYMSLVRIPGLCCVRGMFKIFVGKNCRICQPFWCFHQSICSKTRQRDLRNCPQHPTRDLSKGDTVWWALQNCMFLGGQRDIKRWTCVWSRLVQICGVLPCLSYDLLATPQGACSARKGPAKYGRGENRLATHSFKPRWRTWSTFLHLTQW